MNQATILVVEDDQSLREALSETLQMANYHVKTASDGQAALDILENNRQIGLLLSDVQMQPMDGNSLLKSVRSSYPELPFVLMTAFGTVQKAVSAMRDGAADYLLKPFEADALLAMVRRFVMPAVVGEDKELIAADARSQEMTGLARRVAATDASVMITGESGVGKEVIARFIHRNSSRKDAPFVAINCAAIPENMLESVLFGYEKGAFTGAYQPHAGKFEQAQGGTLLLDEITEMDMGLQAKLLRVLQEQEVERLGGRKVITLDVRVIATTNRDLREAVASGQFREDLFYRLNVFPLILSPLRERRDDILPLVFRFIKHNANSGGIAELSQAAARILCEHSWPGNVRELDNVIQRALILKTGNTIEANDIRFEPVAGLAESIPAEMRSMPLERKAEGLNGVLWTRERELIMAAIKSGDSRRDAARQLGISPRTLRYKLAKMRDAGVAIPA